MISKFRCEAYSGRTKGLAEGSCSRCASNGLRCDRQRPRCSACNEASVICPGYAQKLKWLNSVAYRGKNRGRISFAVEDDASMKKTPSTTTVMVTEKSAGISKPPKKLAMRNETLLTVGRKHSLSRRSNLSIVSESYLPFIELFGTKGTKLFLSVMNMPSNPFETILRNAIFLNLSAHHSNNCLMDGIAAFSSWQMEFTRRGDVCKALEYKSKAIAGLGTLVKDISSVANQDLLLCAAQAIVILTSVDECISSRHNWKVHFYGMKNILLNMSDMDNWNNSLKSVTTWIGWCDLAVAFTAREEPVIPKEYVLKCAEGADINTDGWDLFALSGLELDIVSLLYELVPLAYRHRRDDGLSVEDFDHLQEIMQGLPARMRSAESEDIDSDEFTRACDSNVWLICILLYCYSVFSNILQAPYKGYEADMAKVLLSWAKKPREDHPCCKQMILPLFIASGFVFDSEDRDWIQSYYSRWTGILSMNLVTDSWEMIQEIWATGKPWMQVMDEGLAEGEQCLLG